MPRLSVSDRRDAKQQACAEQESQASPPPKECTDASNMSSDAPEDNAVTARITGNYAGCRLSITFAGASPGTRFTLRGFVETPSQRICHFQTGAEDAAGSVDTLLPPHLPPSFSAGCFRISYEILFLFPTGARRAMPLAIHGDSTCSFDCAQPLTATFERGAYAGYLARRREMAALVLESPAAAAPLLEQLDAAETIAFARPAVGVFTRACRRVHVASSKRSVESPGPREVTAQESPAIKAGEKGVGGGDKLATLVFAPVLGRRFAMRVVYHAPVTRTAVLVYCEKREGGALVAREGVWETHWRTEGCTDRVVWMEVPSCTARTSLFTVEYHLAVDFDGCEITVPLEILDDNMRLVEAEA